MSRKKTSHILLTVFCVLLTLLLAAGCFLLVRGMFRRKAEQSAAPAAAASGTLEVYLLDVGQGQAVLCVLPEGGTLLIDCGPDPQVTYSRLSAGLAAAGVSRVDTLLLSHAHNDHTGGLKALKKACRIGRVFLAGYEDMYRDVTPVLEKNRLKYETLLAPAALPLSSACIAELLSPIRDIGAFDPDTAENELSAVVKLTFGGTSVLIMSDATYATESRMLSLYPASRLKSDVLVAAHHGSSGSNSLSFLRAVSPSFALISAGKNNEYGHPHRETLDDLAAVGAAVYCTADCGMLHLSLDGTSVRVIE